LPTLGRNLPRNIFQ